MRASWLVACLGTRRRGLAPLDLLLLAALLASLALGATRLLRLPAAPCLAYIAEGPDPAIWWADGSGLDGFDLPTDRPPLGAAITEIHDSPDPGQSYPLDDGQLRIGDRLVSAHLDGTRWVPIPTAAKGFREATRWTFVILHHGVRRTAHLTNPPPRPCSLPTT